MTKYQARDQQDDRCSHPRCRESSQILFLTGATVLNANYGVQLCDKHHEIFCAEMHEAHKQFERERDAYFKKNPGAELSNLIQKREERLQALPKQEKKNTTSIDLTGMWA